MNSQRREKQRKSIEETYATTGGAIIYSGIHPTGQNKPRVYSAVSGID
jgi:hypothetical protein